MVTEPELCDEPVDEEPVDEPLPLEDESSSPEDEPLAVEASFDVELPVVLEREVLACCVAFVDADELAPR